MKAFMTPLTLIAVLLYSGATPLRCQEPPPPSIPADRAALQQEEQESARALAEVERQVQAELAPKLEEAAVEAAVKRQEARRQMAEHMAKARESTCFSRPAQAPFAAFILKVMGRCSC